MSLLTIPHFTNIESPVPIFFLTGIFLIVEWLGRKNQYAIAHLGIKWYRPLRWLMYCVLVLTIFYFTKGEEQFIYFQF